jgi:ABC-2 type transport system permease protein
VIRLVRAELKKLTTTRFVWWMLLGSLALIAVNIGALVLLAGREVGGQQAMPPLTDPTTLHQVFAQATGVVVFPLVVGVMLLTTEYRNHTMATTFLVTPRRGRVVTAKVVVAAFVGLLYGLVGAALIVAMTSALLPLKQVSIDWGGDPGRIVAGGIVVTALYCVLGVGLGSLIRSQVAAVLVAVIGALLIDAALAQLLPEIGRFTPAGAAAALTLGEPSRGVDYLTPWLGGLVLAGYALLAALIGTWTTVRRDLS